MHIEGLSIKPVENGHIVSYLEYEKPEGGNMYEPMIADRKEFVFQNKDVKQAFDKYESLIPLLKEKKKED